MKRPPVRALRTANGPGVALEIPSVGWSFQVECNRIGRLSAVVQLKVVPNPPLRYWVTVIESSGSGVSRLGTRNDTSLRPVESASTRSSESGRLNEPIRIGVCTAIDEVREPAVGRMESSTPGRDPGK